MQQDVPSHTARLIARSLILQSLDPALASLAPRPEAAVLREILRHGGSSTRGFDFIIGNRLGRWLIFSLEKIMLPGILLHYAARKKWIEEQASRALDKGAGQFVVLGAGFDLLASRLSGKFPAVDFFEMDHPATQRPKSSLLKDGRVNFVPVDLAISSVTEALRSTPAFTPEKSTIFLAEGLLMYLKPEKVAELLRELTGLAGEQGGVIFSFMEKAADGSLGFKNENPAIRQWLAWHREPFRWGISREKLAEFLAKEGLVLESFADHQLLREKVLTPLALAGRPLAQGECLCHCLPIHHA